MVSRRNWLWAATAAIAAMVALGAWSSGASAQDDDPLAVAEGVIEAFNSGLPTGDGESIAEHFTEDGVFASFENNESFAVVGRAAMTAAFSEADPEFSATLVDAEADGNTVTGSVEVTDSIIIEGGFDRVIDMFTAVVEDGLVASLTVEYDLSDEETAAYVAYLADLPPEDEDDELPPGAVTLEMDGDQPGHVFIAELEGTALVGIEIEPGEEGVRQPAHVHTGTCDEPGPIVYPIASVVDGSSFTFLSVSQEDLLSNDYILNVHLSPEEPGTYVSCVALEAPDDGLPGLGNVGGGSGDGGSDRGWLVLALTLALGGAAAFATGALRYARR
jgi:hypothetical protein